MICKLTDLGAALGRDQRLLGLDAGERSVGLALSDVSRTIATPLGVCARRPFADLATALGGIATKQGVGGLVVGLPVNMDGSEGPRCQAVRQLAANLVETLGLPIAFWDERLSTQAVTRTLVAAGSRGHKREAAVDKLAAAYILQGALDALARR